MWLEDKWRTLEPHERAQIHCIPPEAVYVPTSKRKSSEASRASANSLIGNGYHLPSVMACFLLMFQFLPPVVSPYTFSYSPDEAELRGRIQHTCFQPNLALGFPGVLSHEQVLASMQQQLNIPELQHLPWETTSANICQLPLHNLQLHSVFCTHEGQHKL